MEHEATDTPLRSTRDRPRGAAAVPRWATLGAGWSLVAVGTALLVLPGPGVPLVLGGLALLGREQAWARRAHARIDGAIRTRIGRAGSWFRRRPHQS